MTTSTTPPADEMLPCPNPWCCATTSPLPAYSGPTERWHVICACGVRAWGKATEAEAVAAWNARRDHLTDKAELVEALREAKLQLEYVDERFPTGTTPAVLAKIAAALSTPTHQKKESEQ